jgi:predicted nucleotidyltransferase
VTLYDLRGAHVLPPQEVLRLEDHDETLERKTERDGVRVELVSHDVRKCFRLLLNRNGYALEQISSPLVVVTTQEHEELRAIARACITRGHAAHYLGFADQQWKLTMRKGPTVKVLLYLYRVLLTGIHLMRTGQVEANILRLNEEFRLAHLPEMIEWKVTGREQDTVPAAGLAFHEREYQRLRRALAEAGEASQLPDVPRRSCHPMPAARWSPTTRTTWSRPATHSTSCTSSPPNGWRLGG